MEGINISVPQLGPKLSIALSLISCTLCMWNFSYDAALINTLYSIPSFSSYFKVTSTWSGLIVAMMGIGCVGGLPLSSTSLDILGRRRGMVVGAVIQFVGALVAALAHNMAALLIGRFLMGVGLIINGAGGPSWMMEISPPTHRALLTNLMLALMAIAGTAAAIIALAINGHDTEWVWRGPLLGEVVGPALAIGLLFFTPESPRWLIAKARKEEAFELLIRLHGKGDREDAVVNLEYEEIVGAVTFEQEHAASWKCLVSTKPQLHRFAIAILSNVFLQASGSSFMQYFFTMVISQAGVTKTTTLLYLTLGLTIWQALSNQCGILMMTRFGRKTILLFASVVITVCFALLAILMYKATATGDTRFGIAGTAIIFIFQWAACSSWMLLAYSYPPEILTFSQRTRGLSISQAIGYCLVTMFSYCLPIATNSIGYKWYAILACINAGIFAVVYFVFVETKGKTLEEIDIIFDGIDAFNARNRNGIADMDSKVIDGEDVETSPKVTFRGTQKNL